MHQNSTFLMDDHGRESGMAFEKRKFYGFLGRTLVGGGWALLFFSRYGIQHVAAMRILDSLTLDSLLMLLVAVVMGAHTLRYRSQLVTGLASAGLHHGRPQPRYRLQAYRRRLSRNWPGSHRSKKELVRSGSLWNPVGLPESSLLALSPVGT
jgi:hypothetical protein